jgi:transcriptional regulator with XRE-family HTH domain
MQDCPRPTRVPISTDRRAVRSRVQELLTWYNKSCYKRTMTDQLKRAREDRGWSQQQAAERLGVTQAYVSMLEKGRRSTNPLARKLMQVYGLPPTVLPLCEVRETPTPGYLAHELALLGYPGFAHLRRGAKRVNPAEFLVSALAQNNLEARVAEGLPWVVLRYPDMPLDWLVREARARNLQNRLGFVVTLGQRATGRNDLQPLEQRLVDSKLVKEDSFCKQLNEPERHWLREHSSDEARQWHLLSDLRPDALRYVA